MNGKVLIAGTSLLVLAAGVADHRPALADTTITGSGGSQAWTSGNFTVTSTGTLTALRPITSTGSLGTLTIEGLGRLVAGSTGIYNTATIATLVNSGTISGTQGGVNNQSGTITSLLNSGTISAGNTGINNRASIGTLTNSANIVGSAFSGINNDGTIAVLTNSGTISGNAGINNTGSIAVVDNSGTVSATYSGLINNGTIGQFTNSGTIIARNGGVGVINGSRMGTLINTGSIQGGVTTAIWNLGSLGRLSNSGVITDVKWGVLNGNNATLSSLDNASGGIIHGDSTGIRNSGSIGTLSNSGTISGAIALANTASGSIGAIVNSGVIEGNIVNASSHGLTIDGGSGGTFGTLTGYAANTAGTITSTLSNLTFASGNLLLNDNINVGARSVINTGATLSFSNSPTITGTYSQTGGGLVIPVVSVNSYGYLTVTGGATITGAAITISGVSLSAGETYLIVRGGASSTYTNNSVIVVGTSGLKASLTAVGNVLEVTLAKKGPAGGYVALGRTAGGAAVGVGAALDAIAASNGAAALAFQTKVLDPLNNLPESAQATAVKQLAPSQVTPLVQVTAQIEPVVQAIDTRQLALAEGGGVSGVAAGSEPHSSGLWGQVLGGYALRGTTADADGAKSTSFGLMSGLDFHVAAGSSVGVAASWLRGWTAGLGASSGNLTTVDSYQLTTYGLHRFGWAFVDGQAGFGYDRFNQRRTIGFLGQQAHADYDGQHYVAKIGGGYDIPVNAAVTVTPIAGLRYLRVVSDGYTESGSDENLTIRRRGSQSVTQDIGVKVGWSVATPLGRVRPEAQLAWVHDYLQGPIATSGLMGGEGFTSTVARTAADGARLNLSATLEQSDDLTLKADYSGEARPNYQSHTGLLKATWGF
ncbi:autotransporter outer membrane beta-barrel domain-containing protein [Phaeospirillum tilakii]|uniref:Autotransporter domain-containing protein n=1 Tax=Phaeospirillum tilakii TaxID=741673 RepID=A0ABW5CBT1_9PROT